MTKEEKQKISDLSKCDFSEIIDHLKRVYEERGKLSQEEREAERSKNADLESEYGFCTIDDKPRVKIVRPQIQVLRLY